MSKNDRLVMYEIIPDLVSLETNADHLHYFSFGYLADFAKIKSRRPFHFVFKVSKRISIPVLQECYKHENCFLHPADPNSIFFIHPFLYGKNLIMKISYHKSTGISLEVEDFYYKTIKIRTGAVLPPAHHLFDLILATLINGGYLTFHSSGVSSTSGISLFTATSDTGKSFTAYGLVQKNTKLKMLSEDINIIDVRNLTVYPTILVSLSSPYLFKESGWRVHVKEFLYKKFIMPLSWLPYTPFPKPIFRGSDKAFSGLVQEGFFDVTHTQVIKNIFILKRGNKVQIDKLSIQEGFSYFLFFNRREFSYYSNPVLLSMSFLIKQFNIFNVIKKEEHYLKQIAKRVSLRLVTGAQPLDFVTQVFPLV